MTLCVYPNCEAELLPVRGGQGRQRKYCNVHAKVTRIKQIKASNEKSYWPNGRPDEAFQRWQLAWGILSRAERRNESPAVIVTLILEMVKCKDGYMASKIKKVKKEPAHVVRQVVRRIYRNGRDKAKRTCKLPDCDKPVGEGLQDYCSRQHKLKSFEKYQRVKR